MRQLAQRVIFGHGAAMNQPASKPYERLRQARIAAGHRSASDAARSMGVTISTYVAHENGQRPLTAPAARRYSEAFGVSLDHLLKEEPEQAPASAAPRLPFLKRIMAQSAVQSTPGGVFMPPRLPVFGLASAGDDGRFLMNGQKIAEVECPPMLMGVPDAYAAYVHGESMIPRYESGEIVWVNPHIPPRRRDYVLAQIATDDPTIYAGYVKRFVSFGDQLHLEQFNPQKGLEFPRADVISVHKIVFSGES